METVWMLPYGSSNMIGQEENGERTQKFTKVGTANNNLGPSAIIEDTLGECRSEGVFQEPVEIESQCVTREEPCGTVE